MENQSKNTQISPSKVLSKIELLEKQEVASLLKHRTCENQQHDLTNGTERKLESDNKKPSLPNGRWS